MRAGFAEAEITPPIGTKKIGWLKTIVPTSVRDPLRAKVAVLESRTGRAAIVSLDVLFVGRDTCEAIRRACAAHDIPGDSVLVAATHNHGGPATTRCGEVEPDEPYVQTMVDRVATAVAAAAGALVPCEIGFGRAHVWDVAFNRRVVLRGGIARCHWSFADPRSLHVEGPMDPELIVIAARDRGGRPLGAIVNFSCHPCHLGGDEVFTAGFPGVLAGDLARRGCPATLFLNGAQGNTHTTDPRTGADVSMNDAGARLAAAAWRAVESATWVGDAEVTGARRKVTLPFRRPSEEEIRGTNPGAQRFIDPAIYDRGMPRLLAEMRAAPGREAEAQAVRVGDHVLCAFPGEFFVEFGLELKERASPRSAVPVGCANGRIGYVPTAEALGRGGYESTLCDLSCLAAEAGSLFLEAALDLARSA